MNDKDMEGEINFIVEKAWEEVQSGCGLKTTFKMAVLEAYKAGMESARKVFTS